MECLIILPLCYLTPHIYYSTDRFLLEIYSAGSNDLSSLSEEFDHNIHHYCIARFQTNTAEDVPATCNSKLNPKAFHCTCSCPADAQKYRITESQNALGWKGPLEVI